MRAGLSLGPGAVAEAQVNRSDTLPQRCCPAIEYLIQTTTQPFVQMIVDYAPPRMAFGRVCLIGDAAYVARPHAAAGAPKPVKMVFNWRRPYKCRV